MFTKFLHCFFCFALLGFISGCNKTAELSYIDGSSGQYTDFNGKWLLINYWAAWCTPCIKEIPELNQLHQQKINETSIQLLAVNFDNPPLADLQQQTQMLEIQFPQLMTNISRAPHLFYNFEYPNVLPTTVIISPEGRFIKALKGPQTIESLKQQLEDNQI